ncbi:MAG: metalloregulator ArsR/SmtB family transcription factor [Deltaproteobacteria bacterium]|nr:metalloregulator ArsR/SmtB family transcription factor [Deltaproteobacteria bacterium]
MPFALRAFKALSDETRLRLLAILLRYELSVNELVSLLGMGQSRVSRHLKILSEAGLIAPRRDGLWVFYLTVPAGEGRMFLDAVRAFLDDGVYAADVDMARRIIEDRARKTRQFFNAIAEDWDTLSREVLGVFDLPGAVAEAVPEGCAVAVDLGCGTGMVLERLRGRAAQVIGVDGSSRMLELARRRFSIDAQGISLRIGELDHLPLRDDEGDFVCITMVLHHLSDPAAALREIRRVIRPGGLLLVTDFDRHDHERMRTAYGDQWLGFDRETLCALLTQAGLKPEQCVRHPVEQGLALNLIVARKPA